MTTISKELKLYLLDTENPKSLIINDTFISGDDGWPEDGDRFHVVTIDTNADKSSGLSGDILTSSFGSDKDGTTEKEVEVLGYSEIVFEWYLQNDNMQKQDNYMVFYVDDIEKARLKRATPWERIKPIGLAPGKHTLKFEYHAGEGSSGKKGVFNNFQIWQSERIDCIICDYKPPVAATELGESKTIRGYTRFQEMSESDTIIEFQAIIYAEQFIHFQRNMRKIFYFVDEFGIAYRGIFKSKSPTAIAPASVYSFDLEFISDSKTGYGFC